jgi:hypothetical protein
MFLRSQPVGRSGAHVSRSDDSYFLTHKYAPVRLDEAIKMSKQKRKSS